MFNQINESFSKLVRQLNGQRYISADNTKQMLGEVRNSLLEADVALDVADNFIARTLKRSLGSETQLALNPGQAMVKIIESELVKELGGSDSSVKWSKRPPTVVMLSGLQGTGKTTTCAKLARLFHERDKKRLLVTSADTYRPAASEQLQTLCADLEIDYYCEGTTPLAIAKNALNRARKGNYDALLVDTAGRLSIDAEMMSELRALHKLLDVRENYYVVDAMSGQDALYSARGFHESLPLTGIILTKTDGDARGGAVFSALSVIGKPVKFIGTGEKAGDLEYFHPQRIASRILGMGDVLSIIEQAERASEDKQQERIAKKIQKGGGSLNFNDMLNQMQQIEKMGGVGSVLGKLPGVTSNTMEQIEKASLGQSGRTVALIQSMTKKERRNPELVEVPGRKRRIAAGAGVQLLELNRLLKQMKQMRKMAKKMSKPGAMQKFMQRSQGMFG